MLASARQLRDKDGHLCHGDFNRSKKKKKKHQIQIDNLLLDNLLCLISVNSK